MLGTLSRVQPESVISIRAVDLSLYTHSPLPSLLPPPPSLPPPLPPPPSSLLPPPPPLFLSLLLPPLPPSLLLPLSFLPPLPPSLPSLPSLSPPCPPSSLLLSPPPHSSFFSSFLPLSPPPLSVVAGRSGGGLRRALPCVTALARLPRIVGYASHGVQQCEQLSSTTSRAATAAARSPRALRGRSPHRAGCRPFRPRWSRDRGSSTRPRNTTTTAPCTAAATCRCRSSSRSAPDSGPRGIAPGAGSTRSSGGDRRRRSE